MGRPPRQVKVSGGSGLRLFSRPLNNGRNGFLPSRMLILGIHSGTHDACACVYDDYRLVGAVALERLTRYQDRRRPDPFRGDRRMPRHCRLQAQRHRRGSAGPRSVSQLAITSISPSARRVGAGSCGQLQGRERQRDMSREAVRRKLRQFRQYLRWPALPAAIWVFGRVSILPSSIIIWPMRCPVFSIPTGTRRFSIRPTARATTPSIRSACSPRASWRRFMAAMRRCSHRRALTAWARSIARRRKCWAISAIAMKESSPASPPMASRCTRPSPGISASRRTARCRAILRAMRRCVRPGALRRGIARRHRRLRAVAAGELPARGVGTILARHPHRRLGLAGGFFANVRLNQRLVEELPMDEVFIFPAMGDQGQAYGNVLDYLLRRDGLEHWLRALSPRYALLRPRFRRPSTVSAAMRPSQDILDAIATSAKLLSEGGIVAIYASGMEYGPRALGARTIMASPLDARVNRALNDAFTQRVHAVCAGGDGG